MQKHDFRGGRMIDWKANATPRPTQCCKRCIKRDTMPMSPHLELRVAVTDLGNDARMHGADEIGGAKGQVGGARKVNAAASLLWLATARESSKQLSWDHLLPLIEPPARNRPKSSRSVIV